MNIYTVLPERLLAVGISILLVQDAAVQITGVRQRKRINSSSSAVLSLVGVSAALVLTISGTGVLAGLEFDNRSQVLKVLRILSAIGCVLVLEPSNRNLHSQYVVLRLFALLGGRLLVSANDLRVFYLALELQSLALYVLAASARGSAYSTEAGLKYFRLGAFASGLFLLGASFVYGSLGTTEYSEISLLLSSNEDISSRVKVGFALMVSTIRFKLAVVPFHRWSPDVLEGAPATSSRFFASVTKIAALGALIRLAYGPFYALYAEVLVQSVIARSVLSRVVAALAALGQRRRKRFLAYSGIGHMGFILRGLASGTREGLQAARRYLTIYIITSVGVWAAVVTSGVQYFTDLGGRARYQPGLAIVFAICRFSRAGIPPLAGFFAKRSVFFSALESSNYALVVIAVLASVVGAFYYLRIVKIRYFEPVSVNKLHAVGDISFSASWVMTLSCYITLVLLFDPAILTEFSQAIANNLSF